MRISGMESRRRDMLRVEGLRRGKPLIGPETVQLHITNRCNLACRYCYYHAPLAPGRMKKEMSFLKFRRIVGDCLDLKVSAILLSGEGEPTQHPRFYDMLAHLRPLPVHVSFLSNGTFPLWRCRDIVQADGIRINLAATDRFLYRTLHGKDLFCRVVANIRELARLRQDINPGFRIETAFVMNRLNHRQHDGMMSFAKDLGVDRVLEIPVELNPYNQVLGTGPCPAGRTAPQKRGLPCFFSWYNSFVRVDGKVNICCYLNRVVMADLARVSFKTAWLSSTYARMRTLALSAGFRDGREECCQCPERQKNHAIGLKLAACKRISRVTGRTRS